MKDARFEMRLATDLLERVDAARGSVSRAAFVTRVLEQALGDTPRSSPAGREARSEVVGERPGASATSPLRASGPAPARASESPAMETAKREYERLMSEAGVRPAREFVKPFRPAPKK